MQNIMIYLLSISSFIFGGEYCVETKKNANIEKYIIAYTQSNDKTIRICDKSKFSKETIIHELGHIFYFHIMNSEERKKWEELYYDSKEKQGTLKNRNFINFESMENPEEDFAETWSYMYFNKKILFINDLINAKNF